MGRRIVAGAALAVLMVTLSACACRTAAGPKPASAGAARPMAKADAAPARAKARPAAKAEARRDSGCRRTPDRTGCYADESDRDMGRLRDDLPPGGRCSSGHAMGSDHQCGANCAGCPHCAK